MIKMKFGKLVTERGHQAFVSNKTLGKIFKCSQSQIRRLYMSRFEKHALKNKPLLEQMQQARDQQDRMRWGYRFLKQHEIQWLISADTLLRQTAMSLKDRSTQFQREFPSAHMNPEQLRLVYRKHGIKKKYLRWTKSAPKPDPEGDRKIFINIKR